MVLPYEVQGVIVSVLTPIGCLSACGGQLYEMEDNFVTNGCRIQVEILTENFIILDFSSHLK